MKAPSPTTVDVAGDVAAVGSPPKAATKPEPTPVETRAERKARAAASGRVEGAAAVVDVAAAGDQQERLRMPMAEVATMLELRTARAGTADVAAAGAGDEAVVEAAAEMRPRRTAKWTPRPTHLRHLQARPPIRLPRPRKTDALSLPYLTLNEGTPQLNDELHQPIRQVNFTFNPQVDHDKRCLDG
jgi:hypothetical protein